MFRRTIHATTPAFLVLVAGTATYAQPQPRAFFKERIKLTDAEIQTIDQGTVVTKVLDSGDPKYGVLVFGAVYVDSPVAKLAAAVRDINALRQNKVYLAVQQFGVQGTPSKASDFENMQLDKRDVDELKKCSPGYCDIQVFDVAGLQRQVDWNVPGRYEQVNQLVRERVNQGMTAYMKGGLKAFGSYHDRDKPLNLYEATKSMLDLSYYLPQDKAEAIYSHVAEFPQGKMAGAEDLFYWDKIDLGKESTIRVNHLTLFPQGAGPVKFLAVNKQLYASRYLRAALQVFYCVPDTQNPTKTGFYLIEMNDSRLPDFESVKLGIVRKVAGSKATDATRETVQMYQKLAMK